MDDETDESRRELCVRVFVCAPVIATYVEVNHTDGYVAGILLETLSKWTCYIWGDTPRGGIMSV